MKEKRGNTQRLFSWTSRVLVPLATVVIGLILLIVATPPANAKWVRRPHTENLIGSWIGECLDGSCVIRVVLEQEGKGAVSYVVGNGSPRNYRISRWTHSYAGDWIGVTLEACVDEIGSLPGLFILATQQIGALKTQDRRKEFWLEKEVAKEIPYYPERWRFLHRMMNEAQGKGGKCSLENEVTDRKVETLPRGCGERRNQSSSDRPWVRNATKQRVKETRSGSCISLIEAE